MIATPLSATALQEIATLPCASLLWGKFHSIYPTSQKPTKEEWLKASGNWSGLTDLCMNDPNIPPNILELWKEAHQELGMTLREKI